MRSILFACVCISVVLAGCTSNNVETTSTTFVSLPTLTTLAPTTSAPPTTTTTTEPPDVEPPMISTSPTHGEAVDWFRGELMITTEPGSVVTIDGARVVLATDGTFVLPVVNMPSANTFVITSEDTAGNLATKRVRYDFEPQDGWIAALGDSVMLGSKEEIETRFGGSMVDATVSRQFLHAPSLVTQLLERTVAPQVIIVGLGTNGPVQERHFDEVMSTAGAEPLVVFVNVHVPRKWESTSNQQLAAGVGRYDNAVLVDWYTATEGRNDLFARDGFHPSQAGRVIMADLLAATIFPTQESAEG